jgi:hypothetical protein
VRRTLAVVCVAGLAAMPAQAQQFVATGRDTLRALPGVEVVVEPFAADLERGGLTASAVRTAVERQLRTAGIPLYPSQRSNPSAAQPYLYVAVTGLLFDAGKAWAVGVQVELRQSVKSAVTESRIVDAVTWDQRTVLVVPTSQLPELGAEVATLVTTFIDDWHAVHPAAPVAAPR